MSIFHTHAVISVFCVSSVQIGGGDGGDVGNGLDYENMYGGGSERHTANRAPSATVLPFGRGPSQAADFFSARGAPSVLEVSLLSRLTFCVDIISANIFLLVLLLNKHYYYCMRKAKRIHTFNDFWSRTTTRTFQHSLITCHSSCVCTVHHAPVDSSTCRAETETSDVEEIGFESKQRFRA